MKKIQNYVVFKTVQPLITASLAATQQAIALHLQAAQQLAKEILEQKIHDEDLKRFLNIPTITRGGLFNYLPEKPVLTILEDIVHAGIGQSNNPNDGRELSCLVYIDKSSLIENGFNKKEILVDILKRISAATDGFIEIDHQNYTTEKKLYSFDYLCNFKKPELVS